MNNKYTEEKNITIKEEEKAAEKQKIDESKASASARKEGIIDTDKLKGRHKTEEEKEVTRLKNQEYLKQYVKSNYARISVYFTPEEKAEVTIQAEMAGMTLSSYIKDLIKKDKENFPEEIYQQKVNKLIGITESEGFYTDKTEIRKQEIEKIIKEATEYFGTDPKNIPKQVRCEYIYNHLQDKSNKGFGLKQMYCEALDISRTLYYKFNRSKQAERSK